MFTGCEENPVDEYGTGLIKAYKQSQPAADSANLRLLQQSAETFRAARGRYPRDLSELEAFTGAQIPSGKFSYDPSSGQISLKQD